MGNPFVIVANYPLISEMLPHAFTYMTNFLEPGLGVFSCGSAAAIRAEKSKKVDETICTWICCSFPNVSLIQQLVRLIPHSTVSEGCCSFQISVSQRLTLRTSVKMCGPEEYGRQKEERNKCPVPSSAELRVKSSSVLGTIFSPLPLQLCS